MLPLASLAVTVIAPATPAVAGDGKPATVKVFAAGALFQTSVMAAAEVASSRDDLKKAENQVAIQAHTLYYGILIARLQKQAAEQQTAYAGEKLRESEDDIRNGSALNVAASKA